MFATVEVTRTEEHHRRRMDWSATVLVHHRNQRCEDWNGPEDQGEKAALGVGDDSVRVGDDDQREG